MRRREMAERVERLEAAVAYLAGCDLLARPVHLPDVEIIGPTNADLRELNRRLARHRNRYAREHGTTP